MWLYSYGYMTPMGYVLVMAQHRYGRIADLVMLTAFGNKMTKAVLRATLVVLLVTLIAIAVVEAGSCPAWANCPLDGARSLLVNTEYEGIVAIGVYEHATTIGETHRFRMRCN